jgi:hypothetical protein
MNEPTDRLLAGLRRVAVRMDEQSQSSARIERPYTTVNLVSPRRPLATWIVAAMTLAVVVASVIAVTNGGDRTQVFGAGGSRLLLQAPGWAITRHDEADEGGSTHFETTYRSGDRRVDLHQRPRGYNDEFMQGSSDFTVLGHEGVLLPSGTELRAFWRDGQWDLELRGGPLDEAEFRVLLGSIALVDETTWEAALPETVVRPADRARVAAEMLTGVPLPPGVDMATIAQSARQKDRYQFGVEVVKPVLCGWMAQWVDARRTGDATREKEALDALQSSHEWPVLLQMAVEGDYPEAAWSSIDQLADDATGEGAAQRFRSGFNC